MPKPAKKVGFDNALAQGFLFPAKAKSKFKAVGKSNTVKIAEEENGNVDDAQDLSVEQRCQSCKEHKTLDLFHKNRHLPLGRSPQCIKCKSESNRFSYESEDPEKRAKRAAYSKAYYEANKERLAACNKFYREARKEKHAAYRAANKEKIAAYDKIYGKAYRKANKEKIAAQHRAKRRSKHETA